jgi:hypothetical protein
VKSESWIIVSIAIFCGLVSPIYWWITYDPTGTTGYHLIIPTESVATVWR